MVMDRIGDAYYPHPFAVLANILQKLQGARCDRWNRSKSDPMIGMTSISSSKVKPRMERKEDDDGSWGRCGAVEAGRFELRFCLSHIPQAPDRIVIIVRSDMRTIKGPSGRSSAMNLNGATRWLGFAPRKLLRMAKFLNIGGDRS
jgi:hypothetical protein